MIEKVRVPNKDCLCVLVPWWFFSAAAGGQRWDGGMGDPNTMGAMLAMGVAAIMPGIFLRGWVRWVTIGVCLALFVLLALTQSRGGLVAAVTGCVAVIFSVTRERKGREDSTVRRSRGIMAVFLLCVLAAIFFFTGALGRWTNLAEDRSAGGRMEIWQAWPKMLVAAPDGWGPGNTEEAYHQWYQPLEHTERYRHLLSSHATWMADIGWMGRWGYLFGWLAVFVLCGAGVSERQPTEGIEDHRGPSFPSFSSVELFFPAAIGVWVAFAVAAVFSHVGQDWRVWVLPGVFLAGVLVVRARWKWWPRRAAWGICVLAACMLLAGLWTAGVLLPGGPQIRRMSDQALVVGGGKPTCWVLIDRASMGANYGKTLRRFYAVHPAAFSSQSLGLAGELAAVPGGAKLCVFNPRTGPEEFAGRDVFAWFGEFSQSPVRAVWEKAGNARVIEGVGDFVPDWPERIFEEFNFPTER